MDVKTEKINKNGKIEKGVTTSVIISEEFYNLCKQYNIKFVDAMRTGISILLAEKGEIDYDNKLNLWRKMNYFRGEAEKALQRIGELMGKTALPPPNTSKQPEPHQNQKKTNKEYKTTKKLKKQ